MHLRVTWAAHLRVINPSKSNDKYNKSLKKIVKLPTGEHTHTHFIRAHTYGKTIYFHQTSKQTNVQTKQNKTTKNYYFSRWKWKLGADHTFSFFSASSSTSPKDDVTLFVAVYNIFKRSFHHFFFLHSFVNVRKRNKRRRRKKCSQFRE